MTPYVRAYIRLRKFLIFSSKEFIFFAMLALDLMYIKDLTLRSMLFVVSFNQQLKEKLCPPVIASMAVSDFELKNSFIVIQST